MDRESWQSGGWGVQLPSLLHSILRRLHLFHPLITLLEPHRWLLTL